MIPSGIRRGPSGRMDVPVWMLAAAGAFGVIVLFLLFVLFTMGSAPEQVEVREEMSVQQ